MAQSFSFRPPYTTPEDEPMKHHSHPSAPPPPPREDQRLLEALLRQNQILLELLGAFNGLTAALLARERTHNQK